MEEEKKHKNGNEHRKCEYFHLNVPEHRGPDICNAFKDDVGVGGIFYCHEIAAIPHTHVAMHIKPGLLSKKMVIGRVCAALGYNILLEHNKVHAETGHRSMNTMIAYHYLPNEHHPIPCDP